MDATILASTALNGASAALDSLASMADVFWDAEIFQKKQWEQITNFIRIFLTLSGAVLILYYWRARKLGTPVPERIARRFAIVYAVLAFGAYFDYFNPHTRYPAYYHRHEFFHYYLGSKYSEELGYTRLYECAAVAEVDLGRGAQVRRRELRDLRVNLIKETKNTYVLTEPEKCKDHFSDARWTEFKRDVNWFYNSARGTYWENMQKDHGYNPPPVWTMTGKFLSNLGSADDLFFKQLASLDIALHLGMVLMIGWAFGWKVMAVAAVFWGCNAPANFYWTGGAFMRQDWIFLLVASVCFARKRMFALAGAALTWSALLRAFPLILFFGWGVMILMHFFRQLQRRRGNSPVSPRAKSGFLSLIHPSHRRLIAGCAVAAGVLIPASMAVVGPNSYFEFVEHISVHKGTPLTNHMGLETVLVHDWDSRMRFQRDDNLEDPFAGWKQGRLDRFEQRKPLFYAITGFFALWIVWALRRTKLLWVAVPLSVPLVFCLTNLTCYYYSLYIVATMLTLQRPQMAPVALAVSGASQVLYINYYWVDDKFTAIAWLFFLFSVLIVLMYSRPFSIKRLKAWLADRPEPKSRRALPPGRTSSAPSGASS